MPTSLSNIRLAPFHNFSSNLLANLQATCYMLRGSTKAFYWVKPSMGQFLLFGATALASNFLFSWLASDESTHFNPQGFISYMVWPIVMLISGLILAKRHFNGGLVFVPAILWLVADTVIMLVQSSIQLLAGYGWLPEWSYGVLNIAFTLAFVWQSLALLWIFGVQLSWKWFERVLIMFGAFAILFVWQKNVQSQPIFQPNRIDPTISETAFYAQPMLLQETLNDLQQERPNMTDWYFLGVAGHGEQDVFRSEIEQTKDFFDNQFGTVGRSVALVNNSMTMQVLPIASQTSIDRTLKHIAQQMNVNEDVLFLSLTSHGGDKVIEMSNPPLALDNVDAQWLRKTLDNTGIQWRVIVVSACYSGSFIDDLKTPKTLIITASTKDKPSFGCTNEAEWTYFGQAFFNESLPKFRHFEPAYQEAVQSITKRERLKGFEPSEPQFVIGDEMKQKLPEFEKTLKPISSTEQLHSQMQGSVTASMPMP